MPECVPSAAASSTAVTVTTRGTSQSSGVKVSEAAPASSCAPTSSGMVTSAVGRAFSTTVKSDPAPPSATDTSVGDTATPAGAGPPSCTTKADGAGDTASSLVVQFAAVFSATRSASAEPESSAAP